MLSSNRQNVELRTEGRRMSFDSLIVTAPNLALGAGGRFVAIGSYHADASNRDLEARPRVPQLREGETWEIRRDSGDAMPCVSERHFRQ